VALFYRAIVGVINHLTIIIFNLIYFNFFYFMLNKSMPPLSIRNRVILSILMPIVLCILVFSLTFYIYSYKSIKKETVSRFSVIADFQKMQLERWLEEREDVVRALAFQREIIKILKELENQKNIEKMQESLCIYLRKLYEEDGYSTFVLDKNGTIVCSAFKEFIGKSRAKRYYFKQAINTDKVVYSDEYLSAHLKEPALAFSKRVISGNKLLGVVATIFPFKKILEKKIILYPGIGKTGEAFLVRKEGERVIALSPLRGIPKATLSFYFPNKNIPAYLAAEGKEGIYELKDYRNIPVLAATRYIKRMNWGCVLKQDKSEIFMALNHLLYYIISLALITTILAIGIGCWLGYIITSPLLTLEKKAREISKGDLDVEIPIERRDEIGSLASSFGHMLTGLKEAQDALIKREKLSTLGQIAGGIAHELRNPLGVISNAVYFLQMTMAEGDEIVKEYLGIIQKEVKDAERIVRSLLDFMRVRPPEKEWITVEGLINEVLSAYTIPENIKLKLDFRGENKVFVDINQIERCFSNLLHNAIQAMTPKGGELIIRTISQKDQVIIQFTDTGPGISKSDLERIFEPLFTTKARGIGLGLTVAKSLVEANGGKIMAESEEGKGSVFTVTLPKSPD